MEAAHVNVGQVVRHLGDWKARRGVVLEKVLPTEHMPDLLLVHWDADEDLQEEEVTSWVSLSMVEDGS